VKFEMSDEQYAELVRRQRARILRIAGKCAGAGLLRRPERQTVAAILREWANRMSETRPRKRGQQPQFDHGEAALEFAMMVYGVEPGQGTSIAYADLAERYGVSLEAMKQAITKPLLREALQMIGVNPAGIIEDEKVK
jgi:hypothetical protein